MHIDVPEEWIDVDFDKYDSPKGDVTDITHLPWKAYGQYYGLIPESDWRDIAEEMHSRKATADYLVKHIYRQREGSCTSNATAQGMMILTAQQYGTHRTPVLSPLSLYKRVSSGPNSGSTLDENIREAQRRGILPASDVSENSFYEHAFPSTGAYWSALPSGWEATGRQIRLDEVYVCRGIEDVITALSRNHVVLVGRQGHAVLYVKFGYDKQGRLLCIYVNSWGDDWGFSSGNMPGGFGADSDRLLMSAVSWAVAMRTVDISDEMLLPIRGR